MKGFALVLAGIAITVVTWGMYGPVLHKGQMAMGGSRLRPLICVGLAYFAIAIVVPGILLALRGEKGSWTAMGTLWSMGGGAAGALGALGIIIAFNFGGKPDYVMPLVFGLAPVVNAFLTLYMNNTWKDFTPFSLSVFMAGLILVAVGAFTVLFIVPKSHAPSPGAHAARTATHAKIGS